MHRFVARAIPLLVVAYSILALTANPSLTIVLALAPLVYKKTRKILIISLGVGILIEALILGSVTYPKDIGFFSAAGITSGIIAACRLSAILGANLVFLGVVNLPIWLYDLQLPNRLHLFLATLLNGANSILEDLKDIGEIVPRKPRREMGIAIAKSVPFLFAKSTTLATSKREALALAGYVRSARWASVLSYSMLALAGRLAFIAIPNFALTFLVVFVAGWMEGFAVGILVALLSMSVSNLLLSGFLISSWSNVPAMILIAAAGALFSRVRFQTSSPIPAILGVASILLFSISSDFFTWLIVPELRAHSGALVAHVLAGLGFNAIPAILQAILWSVTLPILSKQRKHNGAN